MAIVAIVVACNNETEKTETVDSTAITTPDTLTTAPLDTPIVPIDTVVRPLQDSTKK